MASLGSLLPMGILTDSYKASHYLQYPPCKKMTAVCSGVAALILLVMSISSTML